MSNAPRLSLRALLRRSAPRPQAPRLVDAWSGHAIEPGQDLPTPHGHDTITYVGTLPCECGSPDQLVELHHHERGPQTLHPKAAGLRWLPASPDHACPLA
ncbi:hypothetical protein [Kitasatospora sp. NPDC088783]|uniref:hypothetical protein n=1 Tax=Kitasatospora sp. NPDC088783 TaxID=3364077 RepID=UPI00382E0BAF